MIDRVKFLDLANARLFGGNMDTSQRSGIVAILDEWELRGLTDLRQLAYMLGTAKLETNATMQPVREAYWLTEEWRRRNLRYYPYYGRGLPQLTWERNYRRMTVLLKARFEAKYPGFDLVETPDLALEPDVAIAIMFEGMLRGEFTGISLGNFFTATKVLWVAARAIINGTDRAADVAEIAQGFYAALLGKDAPARVLRYGDHGADVERVQRALGSVYLGEYDSDFGPATRNAVMAFQRAHPECNGVDGVVGNDTRKALGLQKGNT